MTTKKRKNGVKTHQPARFVLLSVLLNATQSVVCIYLYLSIALCLSLSHKNFQNFKYILVYT